MDIHHSIVDIHHSIVYINNSIVDVHNSIMEIPNWIVDIHHSIVDIRNSIMDIHNCKPITNKAAIMDIRNQLWISWIALWVAIIAYWNLSHLSWTRCKFPRDTFSRNTTCDVTCEGRNGHIYP